MKSRMFKLESGFKVITVLILSFMSVSVYADKTDSLIENGLKRQRDAAASQKRIDKLADDTDKIIAKYHQQRKVVEGLEIYNGRLSKTLEAQQEGITQLEISIENASLIERQIVPLMIRMVDSLDRFIGSDLPFKLTERKQRIERIRAYLTNANISAAERFRKVLEAYSIEDGYGRSIDVYADTLTVDGAIKTVNILQLGRLAIYYQTLDGLESGFYSLKEQAWQTLNSEYGEGISEAIKVAQKKKSPELMLLPLPAPEGI